MITKIELYNVVSGLSTEDAAIELKRMFDEEFEFIINSITLHIAEEYKPNEIKKAIRDFELTVKEIEAIKKVYQPLSRRGKFQ